nr:hypothetical protein [uncultured bacterium]
MHIATLDGGALKLVFAELLPDQGRRSVPESPSVDRRQDQPGLPEPAPTDSDHQRVHPKGQDEALFDLAVSIIVVPP